MDVLMFQPLKIMWMEVLIEVATNSVHTPAKSLVYYPVKIFANTHFPYHHFLHPRVNTSSDGCLVFKVIFI